MPGLIVELELSGCPVLLVGLGRVGRRRLEVLQAAEAAIHAVDPAATHVPADVELVREAYRAEHLEGMRLAFATATPEVNRRVVHDARERGLWVCSASEVAADTFSLPASWRDGPFQVAVSTSGASPALARRGCAHAAGLLGPGYGALAGILAELRPAVLARITDPQARAGLLRAWADAKWIHRIEQEGTAAVRADFEAQLARAT
jgi:siroheme synthase-like protein